MDKLHKWLGVPGFAYEQDQDAIHKMFNELFPDFEKNSGWTMMGDYEALNDHVRGQLNTFFKPFNEFLFELVGDREKFSWDVDGNKLDRY